MCGRPRGFKGERVGAGSGAIMCPALRCGVLTAGPDGFRERTLNSHAASQCTLASSGVFRSSDRPITIFPVVPFSPFGDELAQVAARWGRYASPLVIMAHAVRAILLANATAATFRGRRCTRANNHAVACREPGLTTLMTAVAPSTSN